MAKKPLHHTTQQSQKRTWLKNNLDKLQPIFIGTKNNLDNMIHEQKYSFQKEQKIYNINVELCLCSFYHFSIIVECWKKKSGQNCECKIRYYCPSFSCLHPTTIKTTQATCDTLYIHLQASGWGRVGVFFPYQIALTRKCVDW